MRTSIIAAIVLTACAAQIIQAAELQPVTLMAWDAYLKIADIHMQDRAAGRLPFLWMNESSDRASRVRRGEVVIAPVAERGAEGVPDGMVHDWIGAVFIPGATIGSLQTILHDYDNYRRVYRPVVASSTTLACSDTSQEFQMVWQRKVLFVSAAVQGHYRTHDVMLDAKHGYSVSETIEMREIEGYGRTGQRLLPADTGSGFIWRMRSVARYEERDGGVYLELEATALTRDVPASLGWLVNPVINRLSINSLTTTLRQTRDAVIPLRGSFGTLTACAVPNRGPAIARAQQPGR